MLFRSLRQCDRRKMLRRGEGVHHPSAALLGYNLDHQWPDGGEKNAGTSVQRWTRVEEVGHQDVRVVLALESEWLAGVPALPDCIQRCDELSILAAGAVHGIENRFVM